MGGMIDWLISYWTKTMLAFILYHVRF